MADGPCSWTGTGNPCYNWSRGTHCNPLLLAFKTVLNPNGPVGPDNGHRGWFLETRGCCVGSASQKFTLDTRLVEERGEGDLGDRGLIESSSRTGAAATLPGADVLTDGGAGSAVQSLLAFFTLPKQKTAEFRSRN